MKDSVKNPTEENHVLGKKPRNEKKTGGATSRNGKPRREVIASRQNVPAPDMPIQDAPAPDAPIQDSPTQDASPQDASPQDVPVPVMPPAKPLARTPRDWRTIQWLTPGIGIKRWGLLALLGLVMVTLGASLAAVDFSLNLSLYMMEWVHVLTGHLIDTTALGIALAVGGAMLVIFGLRGTLGAVERAFIESPHARMGFLEIALQRRKRENGERVVAIGGGTGLSTMLRGLKEYTSNITAVVTMADDGGSSGMLRNEGLLPPGDLRNCMTALAEAEPLMTNLFQHRFTGMGALKGHSFGNLVVAAMCEMTGDFETAVRETSRVLAIRGRVLPSTLEDVRLGALLEDGSTIMGQSRVNKSPGIVQAFLEPESPRALPGVIEAILEADVIIIGPGSLFTSLIPNLLVPEITEAIKKSSAPKIYVCNVMTQPSETSGFTASDHVRALIRHIGQNVISHALVNNGRVTEEVLERYHKAGADYVEPDENAIAMLGVRPLHGNFINTTNLVRHDPQKLASAIFRVVAKM